MKSSKDIVACIVDHGLFLPVAQELAKHYSKVYYWTPYERTMLHISDAIIGDGFDTIHRVQDVWSVKDECDLFVFPDIGFSGMQRELLRQGKPVWGHHGADVLETNRGRFLTELKELGMDVPKYEVIKGLTNLRDHLRDKSDKWIKVSKWRGDWETLHWRDWEHDEPTLDEYAYRLGPAKEIFTFYVFYPIDTDIEDGIDTYCIDGQFPSLVMHGMECKDKSYMCSIQKMEDISPQVKAAAEKFGPVLMRFGYRGFFSSESRIKGDKSYFIDPTLRCGSPPSQVMVKLFGNLGDIVWNGANGICIDPEATAECGVQALITTDRGDDEWVVMDVPESIREQVQCGFACEINGRICIPPNQLKTMIGWLTATGDTFEDAINKLKSYEKELPDGFTCDSDSLAKLLNEADKAENHGIMISDKPIPEPEIVLTDS